MKKIILYIFAIFVFDGCTTERKIKFIHYEYNGLNQKKTKCFLYVPKNYQTVTLQAGGEEGTEQQYWYSDSIVVYITNMGSSINYNNIEKQEGGLHKQFMTFINEDTLTLNGKDKKGLLWKEVQMKDISIGYANVPPEKEIAFDLVLKSFRKRKR